MNETLYPALLNRRLLTETTRFDAYNIVMDLYAYSDRELIYNDLAQWFTLADLGNTCVDWGCDTGAILVWMLTNSLVEISDEQFVRTRRDFGTFDPEDR